MESDMLQPAAIKVPDRPINKTQFKNQGALKAAGRNIVLEALTAFKGSKVGKRGLLFQAMKELDSAMGSEDKEDRRWAVEHTLKLAIGMTKDDKAEANSLSELLKSGSNVQINFNSYFSQRSEADQAGQGLTIGFTPPPGARG